MPNKKKKVLKLLEHRDNVTSRIEALKTQLLFLEREKEAVTNLLVRESA